MQRLVFDLLGREVDLPLDVTELLAVLTAVQPGARPPSGSAVVERLAHIGPNQIRHARKLVLGDEAGESQHTFAPAHEAHERVGPPREGDPLSIRPVAAPGVQARPAVKIMGAARVIAAVFIVLIVGWSLVMFSYFTRMSKDSPLKLLFQQQADR